MNRKDFNKRIEFYSLEPVSDGYGGNTVAETLVDTRWAKLDVLDAGSAVTEYGLQDPSRAVRVTIRKNNLAVSKDYVVKYRGVSYMISSGPIEIGFENNFYEFVMQETNAKSNTAAP